MSKISPKKRSGRIQRGIRRLFIVAGKTALSTTELMQWTHALPLYQGRTSRRQRHNHCRAIRYTAMQLGLVRSSTGSGRPILWRLPELGACEDLK
jgi:hypothetical protein